MSTNEMSPNIETNETNLPNNLSTQSGYPNMSNEKTFIVQNGLLVEGDATVTGSVTATSFIGDGSQLTGISGGSGGGGGLDSAAVTSLIDEPYVRDVLYNDKAQTNIGLDAGFASTSNFSIAIGKESGINSGNATNSIAIGFKAGQNISDNSIMIGRETAEFSPVSYAVGIGTEALQSTAGNGAVAVGYRAGQNNSGANSVSVGRESKGTGSSSVSIGNNSVASGGYSIALGYGSTASGPASYAIGDATASGSNAIAFVDNAVASASLAIAIGQRAEATHINTIALGNEADAKGNYGIAIGDNAAATATDTLAIGKSASATAQYGINIRTSAAGSLTYDTTNDWTFGAGVTMTDLTASGATVVFSNLPTTDPVNAGQLWNDAGTLKVSAG